MSERQKFEDSWKSAFDGAEMSPPDRVWSSIELDLAGQESAAMKKRVVFWQRMAAALVLFSLLSGVYAFYPREKATNQIAKNSEVSSKESGVSDKNSSGSKIENSKIEDLRLADAKTGVTKQAELTFGNESIVATNETRIENSKIENSKIENLRLTDATTKRFDNIKLETPNSTIANYSRVNSGLPITQFENRNPKLETPNSKLETNEPIVAAIEPETKKEEVKEELVAVVSPILKEEEPEEIVKPKKRSTESNLWVALGASAGNYSPNTPSASASGQTLSDFNSSFNAAPQLAQTPQKSEPKVGTSYSFGLAVGKKFGRVVLQTGINLGKQQIEYSSNYTAQTASNHAKAISSDYIGTDVESYSTSATNTYTVNSTMEIISIPVQAGYMIIDRRLGWQFNAGVSPDFFIKNVMTDESGKREKFTQSAGDESPYRSVNWSGLLNTELSYRIGTHYRLSLVPGVRYSFNSILKEPTNSGRPVIIDVGFRFRYMFD